MPYSCSICPKKYTTKHKLKEHTMRHDGKWKPFEIVTKINCRIAGVKNHICPFCGLRKTTPYELKVHINYHTRYIYWLNVHFAWSWISVSSHQRKNVSVQVVQCRIFKYRYGLFFEFSRVFGNNSFFSFSQNQVTWADTSKLFIVELRPSRVSTVHWLFLFFTAFPPDCKI